MEEEIKIKLKCIYNGPIQHSWWNSRTDPLSGEERLTINKVYDVVSIYNSRMKNGHLMFKIIGDNGRKQAFSSVDINKYFEIIQ